MVSRVIAGDQSSSKSEKQIVPFSKSMFGWIILVVKWMVGGFLGYSGGIAMLRRQSPPVAALD